MENSRSADILVKIRYEDEFKRLKALLSKQEQELYAYEKRTSNKTAEIYREGYKKRLDGLKKIKKDIKAVEERIGRNAINTEKNSLRLITNEWKKNWDKRISTEKKAAEKSASIMRKIAAQARTAWNQRIADENKANKNTQGWLSKMKSSMAILSRYFVGYTILFAIKGAIEDIIKDVLKVNENLARFQSITLASYKEMRKIKSLVYDISQQYGIATSDVSQFMVEMGKMGESVSDIKDISQAAAGLSVILGEDMVSSGRLLVTTLNAMGLATTSVSRVTGVFLNVIKGSPADIKGLAQALQYTGTTARNVGVDIESLGNMIMILSKNGIKMSKIGTGLRNVLSRIAKHGQSVNDALREMAERGLSVAKADAEFGRRGMNVALILSQNYDLLQKLNGEALPTYAEEQVRAAVATSSTNVTLKKFFNIIEGFFGGNGAKKGIDSLNFGILIKEMNKFGISYKELISKINAASKTGDANWLDNWFHGIINKSNIKDPFKVNEIFKAYSNAHGVIDEIINKQHELYEQSKGIKQINTTITAAVTSILTFPESMRRKLTKASFVKLLPTKFVTEQLVKEYGMTQEAAAKELVSIENNAWQQFTSGYSRGVSYYNGVIKNIKDEVSKILKGGTLTGQQEAFVKGSSARIKEAKEYICLLEYGMPCAEYERLTKSEQKKYKDKMRAATNAKIQVIMGAYSSGLKKLRAKLSAEISKEGGLSDINYKGKKSVEIFSQYLKDVGFDASKQDWDKKTELVDTWADNATTLINHIRKKAEDRARALKDAITTDFQMKSIEENTALLSLGELKTKTKDPVELKRIDYNINKIKTDAAVLFTKYKEGITKVDNDLEKVGNKLGVQQGKVDSTKSGVETDDKSKIEKLKQDQLKQILGETLNIYDQFNKTILDNYMRRLAAEKSALEAHYNEQNDILKAQLDEHLITEGQYEIRRKANEKKRIDEENKINRAQFEAKKKSDIASLLAKEAISFAETFMTQTATKGLLGLPIAALLRIMIGAQTAAALGAIASEKFYPVKYATGGWLNGASHTNGGIPISVSGTPVEVEGGEFVVNKVSAQKNASLIEEINSQPDFTDRLINALSSTRIRAFFTDKDFDAADRNRVFKSNIINYMQ